MPKKSKKTHETTIFTLSHSSLETMIKCPYSWYLKYVELNYPEKQNDVTDFGNLCHKIAENYYGGGLPELRRLYREYEKNYIISPEYKPKIGKAMQRLDVFYNAKLANSPKVYREKEFRIAIDPYIDVVGLVDVIYKDSNNEWVVVDYKSSKKFGNFFEQFAFYYYLISKVTGKTPDRFKFESVYFCAGNGFELKDFVKSYILEKEDIEISESRIQNGINTILKLDVDDKNKWKKKPSILCNWCDYKKAGICEGDCSGNE
jgi:hypothetical protein